MQRKNWLQSRETSQKMAVWGLFTANVTLKLTFQGPKIHYDHQKIPEGWLLTDNRLQIQIIFGFLY